MTEHAEQLTVSEVRQSTSLIPEKYSPRRLLTSIGGFLRRHNEEIITSTLILGVAVGGYLIRGNSPYKPSISEIVVPGILAFSCFVSALLVISNMRRNRDKSVARVIQLEENAAPQTYATERNPQPASDSNLAPIDAFNRVEELQFRGKPHRN